MSTPDNLQVFTTHGSAGCPDYLKTLLREEFDDRLIGNFSDWATNELVTDIPKGQRLSPKHGRIAGDPNRALDAKDLFRDEIDEDINPLGITLDFNNIPVFTQRLPDSLKQKSLEESWIPYHRESLRRLLAPHGNPNNPLLVVDVHDTDNDLLGETPDQDELRHAKTGFNMPPIILSNQEGRTSSTIVIDALADAFAHRLKLQSGDIRINDPYQGGYFTQRYGLPAEEIQDQLNKAGNPERHVVQIEFGRYLYMHGRTQELCQKAVEHYRKAFTAVLTDVADGLRCT